MAFENLVATQWCLGFPDGKQLIEESWITRFILTGRSRILSPPKIISERLHVLVFHRWHTLAYAAGLGKVFSFGSGKEGQLGSRGTQNQLIPRPMKLSPNGELKFGNFHRHKGFDITPC